MIDAISSALSGLTAASRRVDAAASNIANVNTAGSFDPGGQAPYKPVDALQTSQSGGGVRAEFVDRDPASFAAYNPSSPLASGEGLVAVPNVDLATEIVNMKEAEIAYKANLKALQTAADLTDELLKAVDRKV
jgi:flagellar basal-body rod protein FlgC